MNLLEHYIKEIISVEDLRIDEEWAKGKSYVKVKMVISCYGHIETVERISTKKEWIEAESNGYYLA